TGMHGGRTMEARVIRKVSWRLVPFVALCYFVCYLDRVNVGFAALETNKDLGFTATMFGWGAGIFFFGYFFFEVPSNLALERFGARLWIARIMVTWGLLSAAMALIWNEWSFLVVRFLLGAAEAGFFPGIILFLTYWFPAHYRARMVGRFMAAIPISTVIGAPLSGMILGMDGIWGLKGWQWLFICEGLPTIVKDFGVTNFQTGLITAVPYVVGAVAVFLWPLLSDRMGERKWNTALAFLVTAGGLALSTYFPDPVQKMTVLSICAGGLFAIAPLFWTLPTAFLSGTAAAGGIALINSIGNLAGFAAPYAMGYLKDATGGFTAGLLAVAFFPFLSAILVLILGHNPALERGAIPEGAH